MSSLSFESLVQGLLSIDLNLSETQQRKLLQHLHELKEWNTHVNLTRVPEPNMITKHTIDSLSMLPFLKKMTVVVDIGTGAGFPGVCLAIALPKVSFFLLEPNRKKHAFLKHLKLVLDLKNVTLVRARIEDWTTSGRIDAFIARAVAKPNELWELCAHHIKNGAKLFLMIADSVKEEYLTKLPDSMKRQRLLVPSDLGQRYCLEIS